MGHRTLVTEGRRLQIRDPHNDPSDLLPEGMQLACQLWKMRLTLGKSKVRCSGSSALKPFVK